MLYIYAKKKRKREDKIGETMGGYSLHHTISIIKKTHLNDFVTVFKLIVLQVI